MSSKDTLEFAGDMHMPEMEELNFEIADEGSVGTRIKVIGLGGAGTNAVARMLSQGVRGVEFYVLNTDVQALQASGVPNKLAIGSKLTRGLGAGADPEIGRQAALEDTDRIIEILEGADMVFITCGLGGGTGTGAAPVVAALAKELNALTVAVVTKPFLFEGNRRKRVAERGLSDLASTVDTIIAVPNERLLGTVNRGTSLVEAYRTADDVLRQAVQGISEIITTPGLVNRDFADIRAIMSGMGYASLGIAEAEGEQAASEAAKRAMTGSLMDQQSIEGAHGLLINIAGSSKLGLHDVHEACNMIAAATKNDDVRINFGVVIDESLGERVKVTVIATGFGRPVQSPEMTMELPKEHFTLPKMQEGRVTRELEMDPVPPAEPLEYFADESEARTVAVEAVVVEAPEPEPEPEDSSVVEAVPLPGSAVVHDPPPSQNDLDTPAFLRRDRRLFQ